MRENRVKRSRLNLFKATSMTISVLGLIMVILTVAIFAYLGFQALSSTISTDATTGSAYDQLAVLKNDYNSLKAQYDAVKVSVDKTGDQNLAKAYVNAELELIKAQSAIEDVESAIATKKSEEEIGNRIKIAKQQLETAKSKLNNITSSMN